MRETTYSHYFQPLNLNSVVDEAIAIYNAYFSSANATWLKIDEIDLNDVISRYFGGCPPFGKSKKKSEFPDAFNASMLQQYANKESEVYIVSGDSDFLYLSNAFCFKTLSELLDAINSQDEICLNSKKYIEDITVKQRIFDKVESILIDNGSELTVDGSDTDRKGVSSGYDYDEIDLQLVSPKILTDFEAIDIDYSNQLIIITARCDITFEVDCSFFDEDNSIWDSEDKEYALVHYGTMHEIHDTSIAVTISVHFESNDVDTDTVFDIEDVSVDMDIELNKYTLQEGGRKRINSLNDFRDEDVENHNYTCPDCCCEITADNDGGNGFCINCAPNH